MFVAPNFVRLCSDSGLFKGPGAPSIEDSAILLAFLQQRPIFNIWLVINK